MISINLPEYIDGYKVEEQIGTGGNSFVYKASKDGKFYAIKVLKSVLRGEKRQRYENEVMFQSKTKNPNIVKIISMGRVKIDGATQSREYYVMPLYDGSFRDIIDKDLNYEHLVKLYLDICNALSFIHNYSGGKIIHRDIKPENFLYDKANDRLLLSDFGIAYFNKPNQNKTGDKKNGNFSYSAPEQRKLKNKSYGTYTDIFSMGLILNEIFTKQIPNGNDYKKISSVNPLFYELDIIVATMLKSSIEERESNIRDVVNKIKYSFQKIQENYKEIDSEFGDKLERISSDDLRTIIRNDLCLIYSYLPIVKKYQKTMNHMYHTNIIYTYTKNFSETLRLIEIYELVKHKFSYESNAIQLNNLKRIEINCDEPFEQMKEILCEVKSIKEILYLKGQIIKLFATLTDYHQIEVIKEINNIKPKDKPRIYDVFQDLFLLSKYLEINDSLALCGFIDISDLSYLDDMSINDFFDIFKIIDETKVQKLKEFYAEYNITIDIEESSILLICYNKRKLPKIVSAIENELEKVNSYVEEGDLLDAKRRIVELQKYGNAKCDYYVLENVIVNKVMKQKF